MFKLSRSRMMDGAVLLAENCQGYLECLKEGPSFDRKRRSVKQWIPILMLISSGSNGEKRDVSGRHAHGCLCHYNVLEVCIRFNHGPLYALDSRRSTTKGITREWRRYKAESLSNMLWSWSLCHPLVVALSEVGSSSLLNRVQKQMLKVTYFNYNYSGRSRS